MLLFIDACIRGEESRTKALCQSFLQAYTKLNPDEEIVHVNLNENPPLPMDRAALYQRDEDIAAGDFSDPRYAFAKDFARADKILIGAPDWDFSFPAVLKAYIEAICVAGITFEYTATGAASLSGAKRCLYISTSGGPDLSAHHGYEYVKTVFSSLFGINDFQEVAAFNLDIEGFDVEGELAKAREATLTIVQTF